MNAHEALSLAPLVKRGNVGKADNWYIRVAWMQCQFLEQAHRPVPAARAKHRVYRRICQRASQLSEPARVITRKIPLLLKNSRVVLKSIALAENGKPRLE